MNSRLENGSLSLAPGLVTIGLGNRTDHLDSPPIAGHLDQLAGAQAHLASPRQLSAFRYHHVPLRRNFGSGSISRTGQNATCPLVIRMTMPRA